MPSWYDMCSRKRKNIFSFQKNIPVLRCLCINSEDTQFQQKVYKALEEIPYGQTKNYTQIAEHINNPKAVRAVGGANNKNSLAIIIPCTE
ncbi:MAG: O6-methylguanine-DNA--protein-cysteine methyltransferase [Patescibacteria group bacterium]|jgi:O6-methylguanine-DNA--protein-cysteine methyltransferase